MGCCADSLLRYSLRHPLPSHVVPLGQQPTPQSIGASGGHSRTVRMHFLFTASHCASAGQQPGPHVCGDVAGQK